ncbi:MAG: calcium/sodium antiporter [Verrucomicrobiota bacterium]
MDLYYDILRLLGGLAVLYFGAEWLVKGSSRLALRLGISALVVGLTVVAFGTSAPEMAVGIQLNLGGSPDASVGNVVGSNICNILLILGVSALIRPIDLHRQVVTRELPILVGVSVLLIYFLSDGVLNRLEGTILFVGIFAYVWFSFLLARKEPPADLDEIQEEAQRKDSYVLLSVFVLVGLVGLVIGSKLFEDGGTGLARRFGISEAVIGLTLLAFGTSLPELATSIVASAKKEGDMILGNAVGSSIFNILCVLGVTILVREMTISGIETVDLAFMVGSAALLIPLMLVRKRLARTEGIILLVIYAVYIGLLSQRPGLG